MCRDLTHEVEQLSRTALRQIDSVGLVFGAGQFGLRLKQLSRTALRQIDSVGLVFGAGQLKLFRESTRSANIIRLM